MTEERRIVKRETRRSQADRTAATRGALIEAGRALFAERGFASAGREDIVERAGVTRGAMYHHFSSKEALFLAVYEEVERELCDDVARAAARTHDPVEALHRGALCFLDSAATPEVRRIVLLDAPSVLAVDVRHQLGERYGLGLVREALRGVERAGRLRVGPVDALAPVLLAALHEAATMVADGADAAATRHVVAGVIDALTIPAPTPA